MYHFIIQNFMFIETIVPESILDLQASQLISRKI